MTINDFSFSSNFWNIWIIVLTLGNILACWWLIRWTSKHKEDETAAGDTTGHSWDGDRAEYNNPLPRWWLWLFYITLVFALGYLILSPGLGSYHGTLGWSSHESQYQSEMKAAEEKYGPIYK